MTRITVTRPQFPKGYVDHPVSLVSWEDVVRRLSESRIYWMCSVRPDGRPHAVPRWGAYLDGKIYYDGSPQTRHARNLRKNPHVAVHLESGDQAVILEGTARPAGVPAPELAVRLAQALSSKYAASGYAPEADQWNAGGLFEFIPRQCLAWTQFTENPTKFVFEEDQERRGK